MLTFRQVAILLLIGPCGSVALRQRCVNEYGAGCKESKGSAAQPAETGVVPPGNLWRTLNLQIVRPAVDHLTARRELHKRFFPLELRDYLGFGALLLPLKYRESPLKLRQNLAEAQCSRLSTWLLQQTSACRLVLQKNCAKVGPYPS